MVLANDPALTVHWSKLDEQTQALYPQQNLRQPVRIVIDSQDHVTPVHRIVQQPGETWFAHTQEDSCEWPGVVRILLIPGHKDHLDLTILMMQLGKQQTNSIWVRAGSTLVDVLLQAGLVDELAVYIAPKLLGSDVRGSCTLPGPEKSADTPRFKFKEIRHVSPDVCLYLVGAWSPGSEGKQRTKYCAKTRPPVGPYSNPKEENKYY